MRKILLGSIFLASKIVLATGISVVDIPNWLQNLTMIGKQAESVGHQVNQYKTQIDQYNNQIDHYKNLVQNTRSLTNFEWDSANQIISNLLESTNTIDYFKQEAGSIKSFVDKFQTTEFYKKAACSIGKCSKEELNKISQSQQQASAAEKKANDAMMMGIDRQQDNMKKDSEKLLKLQQGAASAEGQKQALQAASQLASNQSHQLLQIRGLMLAEQSATATRYAAQANKEAIKEAGDARFRDGEYHKSSGRKW